MIAWLDRFLPLWRVMLFGVAKSERRRVGSCTGFRKIEIDGFEGLEAIDPKWESEEK